MGYPLRNAGSLRGLGLREQNKCEKRQRIRAAARELFSKRGYDAATLRQIARRAHVGLGTVFNYAQDKRDLVFLVFNEELSAVTDEALRAPRPHEPLLDQLVAIAKWHYDYFSKDPSLSRILLKELTFYSEGKQAATFQEIRRRLLSGIEEFVRAAQKGRQIRSTENAEIVTRHIFFVFSAAIRWWIASANPDPTSGLRDLRRLFQLQIQGLQPKVGRAKQGKHPLPRVRTHRDKAHSTGVERGRCETGRMFSTAKEAQAPIAEA